MLIGNITSSVVFDKSVLDISLIDAPKSNDSKVVVFIISIFSPNIKGLSSFERDNIPTKASSDNSLESVNSEFEMIGYTSVGSIKSLFRNE